MFCLCDVFYRKMSSLSRELLAEMFDTFGHQDVNVTLPDVIVQVIKKNI